MHVCVDVPGFLFPNNENIKYKKIHYETTFWILRVSQIFETIIDNFEMKIKKLYFKLKYLEIEWFQMRLSKLRQFHVEMIFLIF